MVATYVLAADSGVVGDTQAGFYGSIGISHFCSTSS